MPADLTFWGSIAIAFGVGMGTLLPVILSWRWFSRWLTPLGAMLVAMFFRMTVCLAACGVVWQAIGVSSAQRLAVGMLVVYPLFLAVETWWVIRGIRAQNGPFRPVAYGS